MTPKEVEQEEYRYINEVESVPKRRTKHNDVADVIKEFMASNAKYAYVNEEVAQPYKSPIGCARALGRLSARLAKNHEITDKPDIFVTGEGRIALVKNS